MGLFDFLTKGAGLLTDKRQAAAVGDAVMGATRTSRKLLEVFHKHLSNRTTPNLDLQYFKANYYPLIHFCFSYLYQAVYLNMITVYWGYLGEKKFRHFTDTYRVQCADCEKWAEDREAEKGWFVVPPQPRPLSPPHILRYRRDPMFQLFARDCQGVFVPPPLLAKIKFNAEIRDMLEGPNDLLLLIIYTILMQCPHYDFDKDEELTVDVTLTTCNCVCAYSWELTVDLNINEPSVLPFSWP